MWLKRNFISVSSDFSFWHWVLGKCGFDLFLTPSTAHHSNYTPGWWLYIKPPFPWQNKKTSLITMLSDTHRFQAWIPSPSPHPCCRPWCPWECLASLRVCCRLEWCTAVSEHRTLWPGTWRRVKEGGREEGEREEQFESRKQNRASSPNVAHDKQPVSQRMAETRDDSKAATLRRLWSSSLLVMMCVISVSFRPCAMAVGPRVEYRVTTVNIQSQLDRSVVSRPLTRIGDRARMHIYSSSCHSRGKLYMKQACAATIHSALVSQKMAMLHWGFWPSAARPLPKHLAAS